MTAAPAHFPYHHRAMYGSDASHLIAKYERCQARFNAGDPNWAVDEATSNERADSVREKAAPESASTLDPGPDHNRLVRRQ